MPLTSTDIVLDEIRSLYAQLHRVESPPPESVTEGSTLEADLGLDSLARAELQVRLERRLQLHLPETSVERARTVADLLQAITAASAAPATPAPPTVPSSAARQLPATSTASAPPAPAAAAHPAVHRAGITTLLPSQATTLSEVLAWRCEQHPDATHLLLLEGSAAVPLSYRQLAERAAAIARALRRRGTGSDATVALMLPTCLDFFCAFFGVLLAGAIPVPIYPPARPAQLEEHVRRHARLLSNAQAATLISVPEAATVTRLLRARVGALRAVTSVEQLLGEASARVADSPALALPLAGTENLAMLQYTSGSTGAPKGVMLTHANLLANIRAMGRQIDVTASDVLVSWLPLYHDMGLIGAWLGSLYFGCLLIIMSPTAFLLRPARWLRAIHEHRATLSAAPNFGYELAARRIADAELEGLDLSSWRIAFNGAEPVVAETIERFQRRFAPYGFRPQTMAPVYGLAEAAAGISFPPAARPPLVDCIDREQLMRAGRAHVVAADDVRAMRLVSCGVPLRGYQIRVIDPSGAELPERTEGAIQFAGPSATAGYYRNPDATALLAQGIWRNSGDRGYIANGELFVTGRSKDIIIRRGRHLYPDEIERMVGNLPGVRKGCVAAFGAAGADSGTERLIVAAETPLRDPRQREGLRVAVTQAIVECVGEPPDEVLLTAPHTVLKTSSGKLRRAATRDAYESGSLQRKPPGALRQLLRLGVQSLAPLLRRGVRSMAHLFYGLYAWGLFIAMALPVMLVTLAGLGTVRAWRIARRAALLLIAAWRVPLSVQWEAPVDTGAPHVIVVNHCSYVDSLIVAAVLPTAHRFVARFFLQEVPGIHAYLRRLGTLFLERRGPGDSATELSRFTEALQRGGSLVVFPEGTFTRAAGLRPFHLGAFQAAVRTGAVVIPLALQGTRSLLRDGQRLPSRYPVRVVVCRALQVPAGADAFSAAVQLREQARAAILRYSGEPELAGSLAADTARRRAPLCTSAYIRRAARPGGYLPDMNSCCHLR